MVLNPLEFADCLTDSPFFRAKLSEHEKELERTSKFIKTLIHHGRDVYSAAKQFAKAQKTFAKDLMDFKFECIGNQLTDEEIFISNSLNEFGKFIEKIEDHRDILISAAEDQFVKPLEKFRKDNIGAAKEEKKNFDKHTTKFCQSLERYLNMKAKVNESALQEADTQVEFEKKAFYSSSMKYVLKLQEVQEKKKFEFVETLLSYMLGWLTFYHQGYSDMEDFRKYDLELRQLLQRTRENFECTRDEASMLMSKMLNENKGLKPSEQSGTLKGYTRQGYLYLMEKRVMGTTAWTKYYCQYKKESKEFWMILYNQVGGKMSDPEHCILDKCVRRAAESIEKRFCFDITCKGKNGPLTFQALSDEDRRLWLDAMDGKEPTYTMHNIKKDDSMLDDVGFNFIHKAIYAIEDRGLHEQGLYRVVGVNSKVNILIKLALDPKKSDKISFDDPGVYETKTITSAVKNYLRSLPEPLMTFQLHDNFIKAAKQESKTLRILDVHKYVHQLPESNFEMLNVLIDHLKKVSLQCEANKMTVANLGVCFGPSLMRPEEETMAAIMDIKFYNLVVEILINNFDEIFKNPPDGADLSESRVLPNNNQTTPLRYPGDSASQSSHSSSDAQARGPISPRPMNTATPSSAPPSSAQPSRHYANQAPIHPNARFKLRPIQTFNSNTGAFDTHNSMNSSSESLNSAKSSLSPRTVSGIATPMALDKTPRRGSSNTDGSASYVNALASRFNQNLSSTDSPTLNVITRYRCVGDNDTELSFEANQLIANVRPSKEPGWLEGTLEGKNGLFPENYVEYVD